MIANLKSHISNQQMDQIADYENRKSQKAGEVLREAQDASAAGGAESQAAPVFTFDFCALHFDLFLPPGKEGMTANGQGSVQWPDDPMAQSLNRQSLNHPMNR